MPCFGQAAIGPECVLKASFISLDSCYDLAKDYGDHDQRERRYAQQIIVAIVMRNKGY